MGVKNENAIYDRHGNRIRIWIGNDEEAVELDKEKLESVLREVYYKVSIKRNFLNFLRMATRHPVILYDVIDAVLKGEIADMGGKIRRRIIKEVLNLKENPTHITIKIGRGTLFDIGRKRELFPSILYSCIEIFRDDHYDIGKADLNNKVVVDVGANIGIFSLYSTVYDTKVVYAFEPVKETYDILVENIKRNELENRIIPINKGLGDVEERKMISYTCGGDEGAYIIPRSESGVNKPKIQEIKVITLDDFVKENNIERIDFIKMDTEGYEENILLGAKETIKRWKPILSFSAYHKPTDKERLPKIVKSIRPDYKITLNKFSEEDFYCE